MTGEIGSSIQQLPTEAEDASSNWPIRGVDGDLVKIEASISILQTT